MTRADEVAWFDLRDQPWICVVMRDGTTDTMSLRQTFARSGDILTISGEMPTQDVAIIRLLLAICWRATAKRRSTDEALDDWLHWWRQPATLLQAVDDYLDQFDGRFDLLDTTAPFMQVAQLTTNSGKTSGLDKLVPDQGAYFSTREGEVTESLALAEAARWLVMNHAWDAAGIKTGAADDKEVKGGKGYSFGYPAWTGNIGVVLLEGANLCQSLLLNLPIGWRLDSSTDSAVWERKPQSGARDVAHPMPVGPADIMTWQSRRIRLFVADGRVRDVQISNGDKLGPQNQHMNEPMCAWRRSEAQEKKLGGKVLMPAIHWPDRTIWQGLGAMLATTEGAAQPATLDWLAEVGQELAEQVRVNLRIVGTTYGVQNSVVETTVDDRLDVAVLALTDEELRQTALAATETAKGAVTALVGLAGRLAQATGKDPAEARTATFATGYAALDGAYRRWVQTLSDPTEGSTYATDWQWQARQALRAVGSQLCAAAGRSGVVGQVVDGQVIDTARAWSEFIRKLNKETPLANLTAYTDESRKGETDGR